MKIDNQWHSGILAQTRDGDLHFYDTVDELNQDESVDHSVATKIVRMNWNHGQLLVKCSDFNLVIELT